MIISDEEAANRLSSPLNLMNRSRNGSSSASSSSSSPSSPRGTAMKIFMPSQPSFNSNRTEEKKEDKPVFNPFKNLTTSSVPDSVPEPKPFIPTAIPSITKKEPEPSTALEIPEKKSEDEKDPSLDNLLSNNDVNIRLALTHNNAVELLHDAVEELKLKISNVKAEKLPAVIAAASKTIESIRKERVEVNKTNKGGDVHHHFYMPIQKKIEDYEIIEVDGIVEPGVSP